ncbi:hypothetical protein EFN12_08110 [Pediococcus pentosaceus]|uniref:hypothetical protein n=1 Tax=Pediococcus pentosaceus TaxID=1255 RepID=UPI001962C174|nr:hypothetical protein [Pediococcus pentosaceus]MBM9930217.1 hypothetical protein [Pediococcus pentosaceus]MCT3024549.1 hypothetical protein [Pediococcus pentosaceus]WKF71511.1 hypothetical protein QYM39_02255 [Pediococcus pentosaceus]
MGIRIDITGKKFGKLVAKYPSGKAKNGNTKWHCVCECGQEKDVELQHLKSGGTKSCGNCSRMKYDLQGKRFARLTVLSRADKVSSNGNIYWLCRCVCGKMIEADSYRLRTGNVKSCGCLRKEKAAQTIRKNAATAEQIGNSNAFKDRNGNPVQAVNIGARNTSGVIGVSFDHPSQKWVARMMHKGDLVLNATFLDFEEAVEARRRVEHKYLKNLSRTN